MNPLLVPLYAPQTLLDSLGSSLSVPSADVVVRRFPDGESYVRFDCDCTDRDAVVVCSLDRPDPKSIQLLLCARTLRDLGARRVGLVAPYLAYMRQDRRFQDGEGISSRYFADVISSHFDWIVTVDPHLHRYASLGELYSIPAHVVAAAPALAAWIRSEVETPLLIGPDEESAQWVADVAQRAGAPHLVLTKVRRGDRDVEVSVPQVGRWQEHTPVLVDDIISTARTMAQTVGHLRREGMRPAICVGVHGIFAGDAERTLVDAGVARVATANTVAHATNCIDVGELLAASVAERLGGGA